MILRAPIILPMTGPPISNGAVAIKDDVVAALGPYDEIRKTHAGPVRDLGQVVLLPGLINAHCHLDYTCLRGAVPLQATFIDWILRLVDLKKTKSTDDYVRATREGMNELVRTGTTTVVNIESFPAVVDAFKENVLRVIWCFELIDLNRGAETQTIFRQIEEFIDARPELVGRYGFSPHALYTASQGMYVLAARAARSRGVLLTTHLAESEEEDDMFRRGSGSMYDHFRRAQRDMSDCKHGSVVQCLAELGVLGPNCIAAHVNYVTPIDIGLLSKTGTHVVHCPKSHKFFRRPRLVLKSLWAQGINVCLGTDSLASNDALNLFDEMQVLAQVHPELEPQKILEMTTLAPARALGREGKLGIIAAGAAADLITVRLDGLAMDPYEAVVFAEALPRHVVVNGRMVIE